MASTLQKCALSLAVLANGEKAFAPAAGRPMTMPRANAPAAVPAAAAQFAPISQEAVVPMQPVSEPRSSTVVMASGLACLAAGAGMALRSGTAQTPSEREMELTE